MTVKMSISLTDQQDAFARGLVRAGRYASVSAVLQQGLDLLRERTEGEAAETAALRALLLARGEGAALSETEMDRRLDRIVARKRRDHGLAD